ncbi:MAG: 3-hydroxyacyl-CoA dehydrogenase family protein, partial [Gemmatimonadota bacterium]|nr:3-hydroxyacyl-CoA dehydrogenase family protein [Gemmatimonadota bacterium]
RALGREPVVVRGEVPGLVANRLTAALLREACDLVARGAVSAADLDAVVARGIALGWTAAGALGTEAIGAGPGGFAAFLDRLEAPLGRLWASLAGWHELSPAQRSVLLDSARGLAPFPAPAGTVGDENAHATGEPAWAETLTRIARAAEARPSEDT